MADAMQNGPPQVDDWAYLETPIGLIQVQGSAEAITGLTFADERQPDGSSSPLLTAAVDQLRSYFAGERRSFDLPLDLHGTDFQRRVWRALLAIPYGQTTTYQEVADALANPKAVRAVGAANGQNPIAILVPCHRVIGRGGRLVGYGGGLWRKEWLLRHEGALLI